MLPYRSEQVLKKPRGSRLISSRCPITGKPLGPGGLHSCDRCGVVAGLPASAMCVSSSGQRRTLNFNIELHGPRPDGHEGARKAGSPRISRVNFVDGGIETG